MPRDNSVWVRGRLAADPHFEVLDGKTPYIRFQLVVLRDASQQARSGPGPTAAKARAAQADLIRVAVYGERAGLDYFYLRKGAEVAVSGWLEARRYLDKRANRWRLVLELNAQGIVFGPGCDLARGDAQRQRKLEEARDQGRTNLEVFGYPALEALCAELGADLEE